MLSDAQAIATIAVKDQSRAKRFYEDTLGLKPEDERDGATTYKTGSTRLFVYESQYGGTNQGTSATWTTDDVDETVRELKGKGVSFEHYGNLPGLKIEGDIHVGEGMRAAWFKDPDGNVLAIVSE
jgi:catechol 2,3-dioxygenase-like lactoylglutathione lyase family enzyme